MRLLFSFGIQKSESKPVDLRASADSTEPRATRWFTANLDLKTILAICSFSAVLIAQHVTRASREEVRDAQVQNNKERIDKLNTRLTDKYVSKETFESNAAGTNRMIGALVQSQQQIYTLMIQGCVATPRLAPPKVVPYE